jgi:hypothetical protein
MKMIDTKPTALEPESGPSTSQTERGSIQSPHLLPPGNPEQHIALLVEQIGPQATRETVQTIFDHLFYLLRYLRRLGNDLRQVDPPQETLTRLNLFRARTSLLLKFIRATVMNFDRRNPTLCETLDGISFAVRHDLQKTFETELKAVIDGEPSDVSYGRFMHALGVLTNCLQQSVITLAQVFDPALDGSRLFNDSQLRLRQSLRLYRDLSGVAQLVQQYETRLDPQLTKSILRRVDKFRDESLCFLMYKDWNEFETFNQKILASMNDPAELGSVLHLFLCYLRALLGQVKLRAALADVFCDFFEEELDGREPSASWAETDTRLAFQMFSLE